MVRFLKGYDLTTAVIIFSEIDHFKTFQISLLGVSAPIVNQMQFKDRARHGVFAVFSSAIAISCVVILLVVSSDEVMQPLVPFLICSRVIG
jgi:hypothetical protein